MSAKRRYNPHCPRAWSARQAIVLRLVRAGEPIKAIAQALTLTDSRTQRVMANIGIKKMFLTSEEVRGIELRRRNEE